MIDVERRNCGLDIDVGKRHPSNRQRTVRCYGKLEEGGDCTSGTCYRCLVLLVVCWQTVTSAWLVCRGMDSYAIAEAVVAECRADIDVAEVQPLVEAAAAESKRDQEAFIRRAAFALDIELGAVQADYEELVLDEGGFVVEDADGVVHGFDADGNAI